MDFNIDLVNAMKYYKDEKISKYALEVKLVDHASNMSPLDRVDVEISETQEKGYVALFVPKVYGDKQVHLYIILNKNGFDILSCESFAELFENMVADLFDEGGKLYNWHKENSGIELDLEDIIELYRDLTITSNNYLKSVDSDIYVSLIDNKYMTAPDELEDQLESLIDSGDKPYDILEQIKSSSLLPSFYVSLIEEDMIKYHIVVEEDKVKEEQIEDGAHPKVDVATNSVIDASDSNDEKTSEQLPYDYTPSTNQ